MAKSKKIKNTRRGNNEGSIYQRQDGRWTAAVTLGYDDDGKRIRKTFYGATRAEVAVKMTTELTNKLTGGHASVKNDSLQVLMQEWLCTFKRADVSPRTFERCLGNARVHIYPNIGEMKLSEISTNVVQGLLNKMLFGGYELASVRKIKFLLNQFFTYAKKSKFVSENPVLDCVIKATKEHKEQKKEKYKAVPKEAREALLNALRKNSILEPICMIQMFGGMRIGEVLALKWKDFDFELNIINIDNAITQIPVLDKNLNVIRCDTVISDTKTCASVREVPMPNILVASLRHWYEERRELERKTGISLTAPDDLAFSTNAGTLRTYSGIRCMFERFVKANGLSKYGIHFHSLRHTYSNMLFESSENPKVIQMLLGHKDVATTIRIYNSVDRSYFKQAVKKLDDAFNPAK